MLAAPPKSQSQPISWSIRISTVVVFFLFGLTLYVYPTSLNPGLPILGGAILAAFFGIWRSARGMGPYYHKGSDLVTALLIWMTISSFFGLDAFLSQRTLATFVGGVGFLWASQCSITSARDWRVAAHAFVSFSTLISILAWPPAIATARDTGSIPPLTGTFVNPDTFSIIPLLALTLLPGLLENATSRASWFLCGEMGILFLTVVATGCRASLLGFFIASAVTLGLILSHRSTSHLKKVRILLAVPLTLILLALPLSNLGLQVFGKYIETIKGEPQGRQTTRIEVATQGWKAIARHPILGTGPGCFGLGFQSVRAPDHDDLYVNIAHNDPMEVAVELGIPGAILWLALIFACLQKSYRLILEGSRPIAAASVFASVLAVTVYSLFNFVLSERPVLWAELWLFGLALSFPSTRLVTHEPKALRYFMSIVLGALALWAGTFGYRALQADIYRSQSQLLARQLQNEQAMVALDQAIALQPNRATLRIEREQLDAHWVAFYPGQDIQKRRIANLEAARKYSPANLGVLVALSDLYVELGDLAQAKSILMEAHKLTPYHAKIREKRLVLAIRTGEVPEAVSLLLVTVPDETRSKQAATLLLSLELKKPGKGVECIREYLAGPQREQALAILTHTVELGIANELWIAARNYAALESEVKNDDLCAIVRWAELAGRVDNPKAEWTILKSKLEATDPIASHCYNALIDRFVKVGRKLDETDQVLQRLRADIRSDNQLTQSRALLGGLLVESGQSQEGIGLLRDGLQESPSSLPLLTQLANAYEQSNSTNLAISYYKRALEIEPNNDELKAKLESLRKVGR